MTIEQAKYNELIEQKEKFQGISKIFETVARLASGKSSVFSDDVRDVQFNVSLNRFSIIIIYNDMSTLHVSYCLVSGEYDVIQNNAKGDLVYGDIFSNDNAVKNVVNWLEERL